MFERNLSLIVVIIVMALVLSTDSFGQDTKRQRTTTKTNAVSIQSMDPLVKLRKQTPNGNSGGKSRNIVTDNKDPDSAARTTMNQPGAGQQSNILPYIEPSNLKKPNSTSIQTSNSSQSASKTAPFKGEVVGIEPSYRHKSKLRTGSAKNKTSRKSSRKRTSNFYNLPEVDDEVLVAFRKKPRSGSKTKRKG